jgi:hypothetical protein
MSSFSGASTVTGGLAGPSFSTGVGTAFAFIPTS